MRKRDWFNPNDGCTIYRNKNAHTAGKQKNKQCQTSPEKLLLCRARAHKNHPELYARWVEFFSKVA